MATHSSVLAWRIPGVAEPGGLPSMGSHRAGHDWSDLAAAAATYQHHPFNYGQHCFYENQNQFLEPQFKTSISVSGPPNSCGWVINKSFLPLLVPMIMSSEDVIWTLILVIFTNLVIGQALATSSLDTLATPPPAPPIFLFSLHSTIGSVFLLLFSS